VLFLLLFLCDFRTIFTGVKRHTYIDPDYSYTDAEAKSIQQHKQTYIDFIETLRSKRLSHLAAMCVRVQTRQISFDFHCQIWSFWLTSCRLCNELFSWKNRCIFSDAVASVVAATVVKNEPLCCSSQASAVADELCDAACQRWLDTQRDEHAMVELSWQHLQQSTCCG